VVQTLNLAGGCLFTRSRRGSFQINASQGIYTEPDEQNELLKIISQKNDVIYFPNTVSKIYPDLAFVIPLYAGERQIGILCLAQKNTRQDFSADDMYLLQELASVTAMALYSATLIRDVSMRDTFVSIASHELRTPLTSIMGYSEMLIRRDPQIDTRRRWAENIFLSSQRIASMLDDLLNVSRIQTGKVTTKIEPLTLNDIVNEIMPITRESSDKHEFVIDIQPDLPEILVDRDKFGQVIGNLLSNAVKYSPEGGKITLRASHDDTVNRVIVSVTDEGIGISPEDMASLFTTFHRIQRPETQGIRGSGLGLYIAKEWTQAMGGEIWLESEPDKGSTFFVAVPAKDHGKMEITANYE
jgi:signal transduction histidine kinase